MNSWHTLNLGDPMLADSRLEEVRQKAMDLYARQPGSDMGVFFRHESEGRLHCEVKLYFSPTYGNLAGTLGATPSAPPSPSGLGLLAGDEAALSL